MITIKFSCKKCRYTDMVAEVRARRANEGLKYWMEEIMLKTLMKVHLRRSLLCDTKSLQDIRIPFDNTTHEAEFLGQEPDEWPMKQKQEQPTSEPAS